MAILLVIFLSVLLQIGAAAVALRTLRTTERMTAWILVSAALVLMALRRVLLLVEVLGKGPEPWQMPNELFALAISALLLAGMILIRGAFAHLMAQRTELATTAARARLEADRLAAVMDAAPLPIWISEDPECRVIHGNPAADALLRMPPGANHSKSPTEQPPPAHFRMLSNGRELPAEELPMQRAVRTGTVVRDAPIELVFPDGHTRYLLGNATPLRDEAGRVIGGVSSFADLTSVQRVEERLRQAMKFESLGLMAGGISHDFNNLFQSMLGNLELSRARLPEAHPARAYLDRLQSALERAANLSREILHCSGGDLRKPEPMDLSAIVAGVLRDHPATVTTELAKDLPLVVADARLLARVTEGILLNAEEAGSPGSRITVRTYARPLGLEDLVSGFWPEMPDLGPCVVLEVEDHGHGIPPEALPRIFDPFFSTRNLGRGLGLASALGIVRSHSGGIQVLSEPWKGSTFRVYFPSRQAMSPAPPSAGPAASGRRVLLADDEDDLRETLAEMLRDWFGFEVEEARDGEEALACFRRQPEAFDLVLIDATMPRLGGVEAFRHMRAIRPGLTGVLASGYASDQARLEAQAQGFADFLRKPFTSGELRDLLARILDRP